MIYASIFCISFYRDGVRTRVEFVIVHSTATSKEQWHKYMCIYTYIYVYMHVYIHGCIYPRVHGCLMLPSIQPKFKAFFLYPEKGDTAIKLLLIQQISRWQSMLLLLLLLFLFLFDVTTLKMAGSQWSYRRKVQQDALGKVNRLKEIRRRGKDGLKINRQ